MKFNFSLKSGFTLVELLVVIAIIGILSSVAVVNLNSARDKARTAAVEQTLNSILPIAFLCLSDNQDLRVNNVGPDLCGVGGVAPDQSGITPICANTNVMWPDIVNTYEGWDLTDCTSDYTTNSFSYVANNAILGISITCTQNGCVKS